MLGSGWLKSTQCQPKSCVRVAEVASAVFEIFKRDEAKA
jgi:hypothetical protein